MITPRSIAPRLGWIRRIGIVTPAQLPGRLFLIALLLVYLGLAAWYNLVNPIFEAPDEIWHYLYVRHLAEGRGLPRQVRDTLNVLAQQEAAQPPLYYAVAAALTFWAPRDDLASLAISNPSASLGDPSSDGNKNRFLHGPEQRFPWHGEILTVHLVRLVSTAWGTLAIVLTYRIGRQVFRAIAPALAAAATVALSPQFIYISSAVNNDSAVAATGALFSWLAIRAARRELRWRTSIVVGVAGGLVILAKPLAATSLLVLGPAIWFAGRRQGAPALLRLAHLAAAGGAVLLTSGWWFVHNVLTYGTLVPLHTFLGRRELFDEMPTFHQVLTDLIGLLMSYWALFGWFSILVPLSYYRVFAALMALAVIGLLGHGLRWILVRRSTDHAPAWSIEWLAVGLILGWVGSVIGALLFYRLIVQAFQGRLLFGAAGGIAILLVVGWSGLLPRRCAGLLPGFALTLLVPAALVPGRVLGPAYAPPPPLAATEVHAEHPLDLRFGDEIRILGVDVVPPARDERPGTELEVTLYLEGLRPMTRNYTLFLKLIDPTGRPVANVDSYPGRGAWPTSFWTPGTVIADRYRLRIPPSLPVPSVNRLIAGFYLRETMENLPVVDEGGVRQGDSITLEAIVVRLPPDGARISPLAVFGGQISLLAARLDADVVRPGMATGGELVFGDVAPLERDYTVFVHLEGPFGLASQDDSPPNRGAFPTSYWRPGDVVPHRFQLSVPPTLAPGAYSVVVGWYDPMTGRRLTTPRGDAITIGTLQVVP